MDHRKLLMNLSKKVRKQGMKVVKILGLLFVAFAAFVLLFNVKHEQDVKNLTDGNDPAPFSLAVGRPLYIGIAPNMVNVHYYEITDQQLSDPEKLKEFSWRQCNGIHYSGDCLLYYWKDKSEIPAAFEPLADNFRYDAFYSRKVDDREEMVTFKIRNSEHYLDY